MPSRHRLTPLVAGVALAFAVWIAAPHAAQTTRATLPRVYVFTDPSGDTKELRDRQQSVKDMRSALAYKKKSLVLTDDEKAADISVEVLSRTTSVPKFQIGIGQPGRPGIPNTAGPIKVARLRVKVTKTDQKPVEMMNKNQPNETQGGWGSAAEDLARQIDSWLKSSKRSGWRA